MLRLAPELRFPDSDDWPVIPVCLSHYMEYNQTMDGYRWSLKAESPDFNLDELAEWSNQYA